MLISGACIICLQLESEHNLIFGEGSLMGLADRDKREEETFERLKKLLTSLLKFMREKNPENRPKLLWETDLVDDLGIDSLESLDLMNAIEEEFQISPNLDEVSTKRKLRQVVNYILDLEENKSIKR